MVESSGDADISAEVLFFDVDVNPKIMGILATPPKATPPQK